MMLALVMSVTVKGQEITALTLSDMRNMTKQVAGSTVSIHDPSVVFRNGTYYIWGSHLGVATSKDLVNYNGLYAGTSTFAKPDGTLCGHTEAFNEQAVKQVKNYKGETVDFPQIDGEAWCSWYAEDKDTWINGNMWAPDIIYNETMKKWCMYMSLNGDRWASVIVLLTAPSATGPFTYQGPVVMGGFNGESAAPNYKDTDMGIAMDMPTSLPERYNQKGSWGTYWPNCIDPCAFFDETGELWLIYGSWSGGIFMLKLDKETGLRDYTYTYTSDYDAKGANGVSDPYFGKKIAGGYYVSGEGPYIQHIGDYYYLFMSYGGFAPGGYEKNKDGSYKLDGNGNKIPQGGYEMRIFRSKNPDGPYVDGSGTSALYTGYQMNYGSTSATNRGMKLMDAYNGWGLQEVGERSQGHNSACQDDKGRSFVVYHTKFNNGTDGHQVRTHQLFLNENNWLVASPFCYKGENINNDTIASTSISTADIIGDYHFILHPYKQDFIVFEEQTPKTVTLKEDGKITGDYTGTWSVTPGTLYITLNIASTSYSGVFLVSELNGATTSGYQTSSMKALAFTAVANNGVPVWGYKLLPQYAVAANYVNNTIAVKNGSSYSKNISLMFPTTDNTTLTWTSSEPDVISETGKYNPREENTPVALTGRLQCGDYYWEQTYNVTARALTIPAGDYQTGVVAYYNMDKSPCYNAYDGTQRTYMQRAGNGIAPTLVSDYDRFGNVVHLSFGDQANCSYVRMSNPLYGKDGIEGFTVAMWVKRTDDNAWDAIWSFFNSTSSSAAGPRLYLTGNGYLGYNDNGGTWFDINHPNTKIYNDMSVGEWVWVSVTVGPQKGIQFYVNRSNKLHNVASSNGVTSTSKLLELPYAKLVSDVTKMKYFYLGMGSFWGSPDCYVDDVLIFNRELSSTDIFALETMANRVTDFTNLETAIETIENDKVKYPKNEIYDLSGRRISVPSVSSVRSVLPKGVYIVNGKKVLF